MPLFNALELNEVYIVSLGRCSGSYFTVGFFYNVTITTNDRTSERITRCKGLLNISKLTPLLKEQYMFIWKLDSGSLRASTALSIVPLCLLKSVSRLLFGFVQL